MITFEDKIIKVVNRSMPHFEIHPSELLNHIGLIRRLSHGE